MKMKGRSAYQIDGVADWAQTTEEVWTFRVHVTVDRRQLVTLSLGIHLTHRGLAAPTNDQVSQW